MFELLWKPYVEDVLQEAMARFEMRFRANGFDEAFFAVKRFLDLGCASGRASFVMGGMGADQVVGVDVGRRSLAVASASVRSADLTRVRFVQDNLYELGLAGNSFDFVGSNGVLHHHTRVEPAIAEIFRVMRPGARLFLYVVGSIDNAKDYLNQRVKAMVAKVPLERTMEVFGAVGFPQAAINSAIDGMYAVYHHRSRKETADLFLGHGFSAAHDMLAVDGIDVPQDGAMSALRLNSPGVQISSIDLQYCAQCAGACSVSAYATAAYARWPGLLRRSSA